MKTSEVPEKVSSLMDRNANSRVSVYTMISVRSEQL